MSCLYTTYHKTLTKYWINNININSIVMKSTYISKLTNKKVVIDWDKINADNFDITMERYFNGPCIDWGEDWIGIKNEDGILEIYIRQ